MRPLRTLDHQPFTAELAIFAMLTLAIDVGIAFEPLR
jgi:hypothetical protein